MSERDDIRTLMEAMDKMKRLQHRKMDVSGVHRREFSMLMSIKALGEESGGSVTVSQLADAHGVSMPGISQMLNTLEKKGLVERRPGEEDRRVVCIHITPDGKKILDAAYKQFMRMVRYIVDRLGEEDTKKLIELVSKLYDIMKDLDTENRVREEGEGV